MATYTPEPRAYELMVLLSPELGEEALEAEMNRISEQITGTGAEILRFKSTTPWGRRRLAYPIQNFQDAFYVLYSLSSQPGQLDPFERDLKLNTNVIRYLLIRQEKAAALEDEPEVQADEPAVGAESDDQTPDGEAGDTDTSGDEPAPEVAEAPAEGASEEQVESTAASVATEESASEDEADEAPADGSDEEKA